MSGTTLVRAPPWFESKRKAKTAMEHQCSPGLKWLKEGRVSDLGNSHLDIGINSDPWMREWIKKRGDEMLPRRSNP